MKISQIKISKYHQFENFELNLTYPDGHEKAGKPLDKVCFIGQSGTGKTTLLEMVCHACGIFSFSRFNRKNGLSLASEPELKNFAVFHFLKDGEVEHLESFLDYGSVGRDKIIDEPLVNAVLFFSTGLSQAELSPYVKVDFYKDEESKHSIRVIVKNGKQLKFYPISSESIQDIWGEFYQHLKAYQQEEASFRINLTHRYEIERIDIGKELENWRNQHPNPTELVAKECLNPILSHFHLSVKTKIDDIRLLDYLQISNQSDDKTIPFEYLSTGTKQIIFTAFPIYQLLKEDSIVLMDEPETSLYPDIQKEIIPYYTSFDKEKKSQFFFATHSPIIASAFEPWEIVELKFDERGKVFREKYYEGKNHVDNYKIDPRYLRWDDILTKVFDLDVDSNAEFRAGKLTEYAILKDKIKTLKENGKLDNPSPETKAVIAQFERAYDLLTGNWAATKHEKD